MSRADDIIQLAKGLKETWKTDDPMRLAALYGIHVYYTNVNPEAFKAQTFQIDKYPVMISINSNFDHASQKILCAHELGHALLHKGLNHFDVTRQNMYGNEEHEANLFAVALLFDETEFRMPLKEMSNSLLLAVLQYNIRPKQ